ncbi:MAG: exonuclease [Chloroflexi bacterium]|nr:exonuclease [Chloroflexota bacterium]
MLSLTVYGGVGQIGGNQVLVEDDDSRFFFDFGLPYAQRYVYFEEYLNPRSNMGLLDPLEMGLLPPLEGLYRQDLEPPGEDLWARFSDSPFFRRVEPVAGVLLSHAHMDHAGYISFLRPEIPIYASPLTAFILKSMQDSSKSSDFEKETCYAVPRKADGPVLKVATADKAQQRPYRLLSRQLPGPAAFDFWQTPPGKRGFDLAPLELAQHVGGRPVAYFPVDHSIPGACALGVHTSAGWVLYTGDLRFHGQSGHLTRQFVQAAAALRPAVLLGEGSNVGESAGTTEEEVYQNAQRVVSEARGLVVADFAPRNVERLLTFHRIAAETGRTLLLLDRDIYLLHALHLVDPSLPDLATDPCIRLYDEPKATEAGWLRQVRKHCAGRTVSREDIRRHQADYILCFSFFDINELPSLQPSPGGLYIYSSSEAYTEEQEMDFRRLLKWLEHFGMAFVGDSHLHHRFQKRGQCPGTCPFCSAPRGTVRLETGFHASGHASGAELVEMIKEVHPRIFVPVHTESPQFFEEVLVGTGIEVLPPEAGIPINLP